MNPIAFTTPNINILLKTDDHNFMPCIQHDRYHAPHHSKATAMLSPQTLKLAGDLPYRPPLSILFPLFDSKLPILAVFIPHAEPNSIIPTPSCGGAELQVRDDRRSVNSSPPPTWMDFPFAVSDFLN